MKHNQLNHQDQSKTLVNPACTALSNQKEKLLHLLSTYDGKNSPHKAWELLIDTLAKEVAGIKPEKKNISVLNTAWYKESKKLLISMIQANQFVDVLGQFEYEYLIKDLTSYRMYEFKCNLLADSHTKDLITQIVESQGEYVFWNMNAGSGITILKVAKRFVEFGIDVQKLYAVCSELNQHPYNLCLIQLHFANIRFFIELVKNYNHFHSLRKLEPKQYDAIFGNCLTGEFVAM